MKIRSIALLLLSILSVPAHAKTIKVMKIEDGPFAKPKITVLKSNGPYADCTIVFAENASVYIQEVSGQFARPDVTVMEVYDGPFVNPTVSVMESTSGYGDVYVSGTRDLILAAAACPR